MPSRRVLLAVPAALALPTLAAGKNKNKKRKKSKSKPKPQPMTEPQADTALPILNDLALHHVHSWRDEGMPISDLVARYRAGEILHVICGSISAVGVQVLRDAGYQARVVGVVTKQPFNGADGHVMLEVWQPGGWRLYDIDGNRRAVNSVGWGVNIVTQVEAGANRLWASIADDPRWVAREVPLLEENEGQAALDQRVFGTPWIQKGRRQVFHDAADRKRLEAIGHTYVKAPDWNRLLAQP